MIFRDITTEKMRVALSFIKVIIDRKVYNRTICIINPVLRTFCRKNRMLNGKNELSAGNQPICHIFCQFFEIFNIMDC